MGGQLDATRNITETCWLAQATIPILQQENIKIFKEYVSKNEE